MKYVTFFSTNTDSTRAPVNDLKPEFLLAVVYSEEVKEIVTFYIPRAQQQQQQVTHTFPSWLFLHRSRRECNRKVKGQENPE